MIEEDGPLRRKLHVPRRSLDEAAAESRLKTLQFQAYGGLRRAHRLLCSREAVELRDTHEGLDSVEIEGMRHFRSITVIAHHMVQK